MNTGSVLIHGGCEGAWVWNEVISLHIHVSLRAALPRGVSAVVPLAGALGDLHDVISLADAGQVTAQVTLHPLSDAATVLESAAAGEVHGRPVLVPELNRA